jgi:hypothetical protein
MKVQGVEHHVTHRYNIYVNSYAAHHSVIREQIISALESVDGVTLVEYWGAGNFRVTTERAIQSNLIAAVKGI